MSGAKDCGVELRRRLPIFYGKALSGREGLCGSRTFPALDYFGIRFIFLVV